MLSTCVTRVCSSSECDFVDETWIKYDRICSKWVPYWSHRMQRIHFRVYVSFLKLFSLKLSTKWAFVWLSTTKLIFSYSGYQGPDPLRKLCWRGGSNIIRSEKNFYRVIRTYQGWVGLMSSLIWEKCPKMKHPSTVSNHALLPVQFYRSYSNIVVSEE